MLYRDITRTGEPNAQGWCEVHIIGEEAVPCHFCGAESQPAECPGDGRWHHHGFVHAPGALGHIALCGSTSCQTLAKAMYTAIFDQNTAARP